MRRIATFFVSLAGLSLLAMLLRGFPSYRPAGYSWSEVWYGFIVYYTHFWAIVLLVLASGFLAWRLTPRAKNKSRLQRFASELPKAWASSRPVTVTISEIDPELEKKLREAESLDRESLADAILGEVDDPDEESSAPVAAKPASKKRTTRPKGSDKG